MKLFHDDDMTPRARATWARSIEHLIRDIDRPQPLLRSMRPIYRRNVAAAAVPALTEIRWVLVDDQASVTPEAMSRLREFLTDGSRSPALRLRPRSGATRRARARVRVRRPRSQPRRRRLLGTTRSGSRSPRALGPSGPSPLPAQLRRAPRPVVERDASTASGADRSRFAEGRRRHDEHGHPRPLEHVVRHVSQQRGAPARAASCTQHDEAGVELVRHRR